MPSFGGDTAWHRLFKLRCLDARIVLSRAAPAWRSAALGADAGKIGVGYCGARKADMILANGTVYATGGGSVTGLDCCRQRAVVLPGSLCTKVTGITQCGQDMGPS